MVKITVAAVIYLVRISIIWHFWAFLFLAAKGFFIYFFFKLFKNCPLIWCLQGH